MIRKPIAQDNYYPSDFTKLDEFISTCFKGSKGPGTVSSRGITEVSGILVPYDKYSLSGPTCAWGYKDLGESDVPQTIVIIAPSLISTTTCVSDDDFETPFGKVQNDTALTNACLSAGIELNNDQHRMETQIEVQIPFIQFTYSKHLSKIKILPILIGKENPSDIIQKLQKVFSKEKRRLKWVISTNLTHYGPGYHYIPFEIDVEEKLSHLDKELISLINRPADLATYASQKMVTWFGLNTIIIAKHFLGEAQISHYTNTGKILGEWKNVVSYGAIKFV